MTDTPNNPSVYSGMRQRSKKQAKLYVERRKLVERLLQERPFCERHMVNFGKNEGIVFWGWGQQVPSTVIHEKKLRSAGGSITDESNLVALCAECHDDVHRHPAQARAEGWIVRRFE